MPTVVRDLWHIRLRTLSWTQNRDNKPPLRPLDTLVLCYFGLVILQLPVSLHDLHTWLSFSSSSLMPPPPAPPAPTDPPTNSNEITHLLYYLTLTHLPAPLLHRLPPTYLAALTPSPLTPSRLQTGLHALARLYRDDLGIAFPPLNFAPLAYRAYVDGLRLPLEALPVVEKLARGAGVGWGFAASGGDEGGEGGGGVRKRWKVDARCWLPEAQLAALVVVAMETVCPFGPPPPGGGGEGETPAARRGVVAGFGWGEWIGERERAAAAAARAAATKVVGRATGGGEDGEEEEVVVVDEYLSAAEKMLQGQNADDSLGLPKATALLSGADADEDEDEDEDEELDGLLRGDQRVFYEAVARQAVMPVSLLVKSVGLIERKLEESAKKIREGRKRSGVAR
ncbi:hypothetical protein SLS54_006562 [Diplodia seriata]